MTFKELNLSEKIVSALQTQNITQPTPVQELAIPAVLEGKNVIIKSQTGSGKTLAYLLPLYEKITGKGNQAVIIVPTRELAMQVHSVVIDFSKSSNTDVKSAVIFGGVNVKTQIEKLKDKPQIIIGTIDRVEELIKKKKISAHTVKTFIVDEADKLVDKQSVNALKNLRKCFMRDTQNVFVSATFATKNIEAIKEISLSVELLHTSDKEVVPENIEHYYIVSEQRDKLETLRKLIGIMKPSKSLIFLNDLDQITLATTKLNYHNFKSASVHSDSSKEERQKALRGFADGSFKYLVSTDLAARGIDIDNISCVYHISIAENPSDYLHRAGRTGRNGKSGVSLTMVNKQELQFIKKYSNRYSIDIKEVKMHAGEITFIDENGKVVKLY